MKELKVLDSSTTIVIYNIFVNKCVFASHQEVTTYSRKNSKNTNISPKTG